VTPSIYERLSRISIRRLALAMAVACVGVAAWLAVAYREMGGPGDQLEYFEQAAHLIPYVHHYYGPGYFVALRLVHMVVPLDWFSAGKVLALLSLAGYLIVCSALFGRLLGDKARWLALIVLVLTPEVLSGGYEVSTNMYTAVFVIAAIWVTTRARIDGHRDWLLAGFLFGLSYLTRFSSAGYILGAVAGVWLLRAPLKSRLRLTVLLGAGAALPVVGWYGFLYAVQGYVPANYNFIHLTYALGQFQSFSEMDQLTREYGSFFGVIRSDPTIPVRLLTFGAKEFLKFPFTVGFKLHFVLAGFLIPGLLTTVARRDSHAPWLIAFLTGLFLTGLASRGWGPYYLPVVPFGIILIVLALEALSRPWGRTARLLIGATLTLVVVAWTVAESTQSFRERDWVEFGVARRYLERHANPGRDVVSTSTPSLLYGSDLPFVDHSAFRNAAEPVDLVDWLREHSVNYLVVSERHTLFEFPELRPLLADVPRAVPAGLVRDTLITSPRRLAIYRVLPAGGEGQP